MLERAPHACVHVCIQLTLLHSMEVQEYAEGEPVIEQGDREGKYFFIVDRGELDCFVRSEGHEGYGRKVTHYGPGATFGELALMYNCPRAASIVPTTPVALFAIARDVFRTLILQKYMAQRMRFEQILETIPLLQSMNTYERAALADGFHEEPYEEGAAIITEGEHGSIFYLLTQVRSPPRSPASSRLL